MVIDNIFISGSGSLAPILYYYDVACKTLANHLDPAGDHHLVDEVERIRL
jgi:hypothetical protein